MKCNTVHEWWTTMMNSHFKIPYQRLGCKDKNANQKDLSVHSRIVSEAWRKVRKNWINCFKQDTQSKMVHCLRQKMEAYWYCSEEVTADLLAILKVSLSSAKHRKCLQSSCTTKLCYISRHKENSFLFVDCNFTFSSSLFL